MSIKPRLRGSRGSFTLILLAVCLASSPSATGQVVSTASGKLAQFAATTAEGDVVKQDTGFTPMPDIPTSFTMKAPGPVSVSFCADCGVNTGLSAFGQLLLRATIDGSALDPQPWIAWASNGDSDNGLLRAPCFNWLAASEMSGDHEVNIEWAMNTSGGGVATCTRRSLLVQWER